MLLFLCIFNILLVGILIFRDHEIRCRSNDNDLKGVVSRMEKDEVKKAVLELIEDVMPELEDVAFDKNIVSEYGVSSVSIIKLIVEAEKKFEVSFSDYELALDSYDTFGDFAQVVYEKLEDVE